MLDKVPAADTTLACVRQQFVHDVQLVIAGKDLFADWMPGNVGFLHDLCVVLDNVGDTLTGQCLGPEIPRLDASGVGRVAGAVIVPLVEGQEDGFLAGQLGAELDLVVIHGKVHQTPPKLKQ